MLKHFAVAAAIVAVLAMIALAAISARFVDQKEILRVTAERDELRADHAALEMKIAALDEEKRQLNVKIEQQQTEIAGNKQEIARLQKANDEARLSVRRLRTSDQEVKAFAAAFPGIAAAKNFGATDIFDDRERVTLPYLCVPLAAAETFVIQQTTMNTYKAQIDDYKKNETLYEGVIDLKDQVLALETQKSMAFHDEYEKVFAKYEDVNGRYIKLLETPRFKFGGLGMTIGAGILGLAIGAGL